MVKAQASVLPSSDGEKDAVVVSRVQESSPQLITSII